MRTDSPPASAPSVSVDDLLDVPLIGMRSGYVMHRYVIGFGDPLERRGALTHRPISGDTTQVLLMLQRRRAESVSRAARDLHEVFVRTARTLSAAPGAP